ncbi:protein YgfX [Pseudaeromonas sharmana]|uniref:Protein YgfX n=1 Tax=Pseudaeromonas sharmana TaxID=328412 RepID=A0ABV8CMP4_9GAMM
MTAIRRVLQVSPSLRHQQILLGGHLLLLLLLSLWLHGGVWYAFCAAWGLSLCWAVWQARQRYFALEWSGETLYWQQQRFSLGSGSRIAAGFLWLDLQGESRHTLWIFADSLSDEAYRFLARQIRFRAGK